MSPDGSADAIARAQLLLASGELTAASYVLDQHLRAHPGDGAALIQLAQILAQQGDLGAAARAAEEAARDADVAPWALATRAQIVSYDEARTDEALALARDAVRARRDNSGLRIVFATILGRSGRTEEALAEVEAALALAPGDPFLLAQLHAQAARALVSAPGALEEARSHARMAVELDPTDDDAAQMVRILDARAAHPGPFPDLPGF